MNLTRRRFSQHAISSASLLAAASIGSTAYAQSSKIILGQSCPLTGAAAQLGIQFNAGASVFFDLLNAKGGVGGRQIEIAAMDDAYDPARCAATPPSSSSAMYSPFLATSVRPPVLPLFLWQPRPIFRLLRRSQAQ